MNHSKNPIRNISPGILMLSSVPILRLWSFDVFVIMWGFHNIGNGLTLSWQCTRIHYLWTQLRNFSNNLLNWKKFSLEMTFIWFSELFESIYLFGCSYRLPNTRPKSFKKNSKNCFIRLSQKHVKTWVSILFVRHSVHLWLWCRALRRRLKCFKGMVS